MTGTAMTEEAEFGDIYNLSCIEIPTNRPVQRVDHHDEIYRTAKEKYDAIIKTILECHAKGQPVWSAPLRSKSRNWWLTC